MGWINPTDSKFERLIEIINEINDGHRDRIEMTMGEAFDLKVFVHMLQEKCRLDYTT